MIKETPGNFFNDIFKNIIKATIKKNHYNEFSDILTLIQSENHMHQKWDPPKRVEIICNPCSYSDRNAPKNCSAEKGGEDTNTNKEFFILYV